MKTPTYLDRLKFRLRDDLLPPAIVKTIKFVPANDKKSISTIPIDTMKSQVEVQKSVRLARWMRRKAVKG